MQASGTINDFQKKACRETVYFVGIGGTGMAAVAGLLQEAGFHVLGSDAKMYPPMSTMLEDLGISVLSPYSEENIAKNPASVYVIANSLSRSHPEIEYILRNELPYTSFPAFLGDKFLQKKKSLVVCGTHGKTTTASLLTHLLTEMDEDPSFIIGGLPKNLGRSFHVGKGDFFVIEGDEYDTCFFDKESKFLHYNPCYTLFNNLEYDHADIFPSLESLESMFLKLFKLLPDPQNLIANISDPGVNKIIQKIEWEKYVFQTGSHTKDLFSATEENRHIEVLSSAPCTSFPFLWQGQIKTSLWGTLPIRTRLPGPHNLANIAQALGCLTRLFQNKELKSPTPSSKKIITMIEDFEGVKRRFERLYSDKIFVYEDFAHHPTSVSYTVESIRTLHPHSRIIAAFEPRNATSRRNIFQHEYAKALQKADISLLGEVPYDRRIPEEQKMNLLNLTSEIGSHRAFSFDKNSALLEWLYQQTKPNDVVVFMSSGEFSGIQHQFVQHLEHLPPQSSPI
ncbi:MAG: hypothetical protein KA436_02095 [Oligoflexales bacterium]|nr:hypothetical protein [Oligoflexales bacterium]